MKKILQLLALLPALAFGQTAVQKVGGGNNALSNGSIIVPSGISITATGTGVIAATSIPSISIITTAPLAGGGALTGNLTLSIPAATGSVNGYLTSADWTTFNAKQPAGNYITALTGDGTAAGPGSAVLTLASVISASSVGSSTAIPVLTYDAKGRLTLTSTAAVIAPAGTLTGATLAANVLASSLTSVGTIGTGVWQGTVIAGQYGGTGVANTGKTITIGGNLTTSGAFTTTLTATANTTLTMPVTGTLATLAGAEALTNKTYNGNTWTAGTGTLTIAAGKTLTQSNTLTFTGTDSSSVNFGAGGTVLYSGGSYVSSITGTAGQITASASTGAVTLSLPTALTGVNSVTSAALSNFTLGTGTFGTFLTATSATGAVTLANSLAITGALSGVTTTSSAGLNTNVVNGSTAFRAASAASGAYSVLDFGVSTAGGYSYINSDSIGGGTVQPLVFSIGGVERVRFANTLNTFGRDSTFTSATNSTNSTTGSLLIGNGSAATNVGIGGGNIWAGGTANFAGGTVSGNLLFTDNTYDIGASGATRPRSVFTSQNVNVGGSLNASTGTTAGSNGITIAGNSGTNYGFLSYSSVGQTTLSIDNAFDSATAAINFRVRTLGTPVTALALNATTATFAGNITGSTLTTLGGATFHTTSTALTNGAGVGAGTLTTAPSAGNPTKWIGINDNGTTRYIPAW